ncbi:uncharacterized protein LOC141901888 isoform X2 [Tubulanus polymorphus]
MSFMEENHIQIGSVGVMHSGKLVYARDIKRIGLEQSVVQQTTQMFPMLQVSHMMTSLAVLHLSDKNSIDLNRKVFVKSGALSGFLEAIPDSVDPRIRDITVMQLLYETAGWDRHEDFRESGVLLPSDAIRTMLQHKLHSVPGKKFKHSAFNELLLRIIIEDVTGISYEEYVKRHILIPFGMWMTKLTRHPLEDAAGGIYNTNLIPTTWVMTIQDAMRLVSAVTHDASPIIRKDTLKLIFTRPSPPYPRLTDTWHGMGVKVKTDGSFWVESYASGNYLLLHSYGPDSAFITHFKTHNPTLFKHLFLDYFKRVDNWVDTDDLMGGDLFSSLYKDDGISFRIHEQHLSAYIEALRKVDYRPTWINAYSDDRHQVTFFAVIAAKTSATSKNDWLLQHGIPGERVDTVVGNKERRGYRLNLIQNYVCYSHEDRKCSLVLMRTPRNRTADIVLVNQPYSEYLKKVPDYHRDGYVATVQSVMAFNGQRRVSAVLLKNADAKYKPFLDLTIDDFERVIYEEALNGFNLCYLDTYHNNEKLLFSAVFEQGPGERWILQQDLNLSNLAREIELLKQTKLFPKMIVGYERNNTNYFSIFYT